MNEIATILVLILWYPNNLKITLLQLGSSTVYVPLLFQMMTITEASIMFPLFEEDYEL